MFKISHYRCDHEKNSSEIVATPVKSEQSGEDKNETEVGVPTKTKR